MHWRPIFRVLGFLALQVCFSATVWPQIPRPAGTYRATRYQDGRVLVQWRPVYDANNLGFNVFREEGDRRILATPQLVAGSALFASASPGILLAERSYRWWDRLPKNQRHAEYWIEELDLSGRSTWHGPILTDDATAKPNGSFPESSRSLVLAEVGSTEISEGTTQPMDSRAMLAPETAEQSSLAGQPVVKISVRQEGWYRVTARELATAGLDPNVTPSLLQLFADGREHPIQVFEQAGQLSAIEFYGIGTDSPYTDLRVYWLVAGSQPGQRIPVIQSSAAPGAGGSFPYAVERKDRTVYFSALLNGEKENFFGALVTANPVDQVLRLQNVATGAPGEAMVAVTLQGVTALPHSVEVLLNGTALGKQSFSGQTLNTATWTVAQTQLREGENLVTLRTQGIGPDISLVESIRITYWHNYNTNDTLLRLTATGNDQLTIEGFTSPVIRVLDVTDAATTGPQEIAGTVRRQNRVPPNSRTRVLLPPDAGGIGPYSVNFTVPGVGQRKLLVLSSEQIQRPVAVTVNRPSSWRAPENGADYLIITRREFFPSVEPLRALRESQGLSVAVIDVEDIYDEFSYGQKTPRALKDFLSFAAASWKKPPRFLLLVGHASFDPKNYLGLGGYDLVPTKLIDTLLMETASDDWFVESGSDGLPKLAMGRLPARDKAEADLMVSKIVAYEQSASASWALFVSGQNDDGYDFEAASAQLRSLMPASLQVSEIRRGADPATAKTRLLESLRAGPKLVNYAGHGSVDLWGGELLTDPDARALENDRLPVIVAMTCLNGYFQDPALDSLAESLLKAERGGAVAVWASSGWTTPPGQLLLTQQFYRFLFSGDSGTTLGEAAMRAKPAVSDPDVRRTWILFGDPATRIK